MASHGRHSNRRRLDWGAGPGTTTVGAGHRASTPCLDPAPRPRTSTTPGAQHWGHCATGHHATGTAPLRHHEHRSTLYCHSACHEDSRRVLRTASPQYSDRQTRVGVRQHPIRTDVTNACDVSRWLLKAHGPNQTVYSRRRVYLYNYVCI